MPMMTTGDDKRFDADDTTPCATWPAELATLPIVLPAELATLPIVLPAVFTTEPIEDVTDPTS